MSRADERIRGNLQELERPVRTDVFERVAGRKRRRRMAHRVGVIALATVVLGGTVLGTYGLLRVFAPSDRSRPGGGGDTAPETGISACDLSAADTADIDGNGLPDLVEVFSPVPVAVGEPLPPEGVACADPVVGERYVIRVQFRSEDPLPSIGQDLPECAQPYACRIFATPDLDGDGRAEVAVVFGEGASTISWTVYRLDASDPEVPSLVRLEIAEPGDPWDTTYGLQAGPATFTWYGSVTHQQWLSCDEDPEHRPAAVTALRSEEDPGRYVIHGTLLRLIGAELRPEFSWDEEIRESELRVPATMCGAELIPAG